MQRCLLGSWCPSARSLCPEADMLKQLLPHLWSLLLFAVHMLVCARALTRPNRIPSSRVAWVAVIMLLPVLGVVAYFLLGETNIGRGRVERLQKTEARLRLPTWPPVAVPDHAAALFDLGHSISGLAAVGGNRIRLLGDPAAPLNEPMRNAKAAMDTLIADISQARSTVHIAFYIWLDDDTGQRMAQAVEAAARRGVVCRVMVDALGSRAFLKSPLWGALAQAGVKQLATLDDLNRWQHFAFSRMDLRDHRKLVVIDNRIAYCGSQNCADPEFRIKAKYAPWIDVLFRCEGPVAQQMQALFLGGWIPETGEQGLDGLACDAPLLAQEAQEEIANPGCVAQLFETGPTARHNAMSDMFVACMYAARHELVITTPYFVPDESILRALCAAPRRGVKTTLILPARNDSWLVGNASRSSYADLLDSGVQLYEYPLGLLHAKTLTVDGNIALVGSANMDRRSLDLNYENSLLIADAEVTETIRARQLGYLAQAQPVSADVVRAWPFHTRLVHNVVGMMAPVL